MGNSRAGSNTGTSGPKPTLLIVSQAYVPDPTSVGQHIADVAAEMAGRGWRVIVYTASRGWEDSSVRYPRREIINGVEVRRLAFSSFGKKRIAIRFAAGMMFVLQATIRGLFVRRLDYILVSTCPPMAPIAGVVISRLRRLRLTFWQMDVNPDQMVALGMIRQDSLPARAFNLLNRLVLSRASNVVVLDRFMADRVNAKLDVRKKMTILPPWPHEDHLEPVASETNPFRIEHKLTGKRVVMYSGNHTASNPVGAILAAAQRLRDDPRLAFMFVGGGAGKKEVDAVSSPNIISLPYQPLDQIKYSLSAADVHLVTVGDAVVGIVHPCKVYGAMAVARPVLLMGPEQCHVSDLLQEHDWGWHIPNGDVDRAEQVLRAIAETSSEELMQKGLRARALMTQTLSKAALCGRFCDVMERDAGARVGPAT